MYEYKGTIVSVYDGDTVTVSIDLGFDVAFKTSVRLARINAPEVKGAEKIDGLRSRDYVRSLLPVGSEVTFRTYKDGEEKYGRYLADVFLSKDDCLNDAIVTNGFGKYKEY